MRLMETIRKKGSAWLIGFLGFFLVSVFAGLGVGAFNFGSSPGSPAGDQGILGRPTLSSQSDAVLHVNGVAVDQARFDSYATNVLSNSRQALNDDPSFILDVYAFTSQQLIREEVISQKGASLGVKVTNEEVAEAKANAIAPLLNIKEGSSGNVLGDLTKGLGTARDRKAAFNEHLNQLGVSEKQWKSRVRRELLLSNTTTQLQEVADNAALLKAEETKILVDEALLAGDVFQEVAREFSDDPNAARGGDIGTWIRRGLLSEEIEDVLYSLGKGETTDWFEVGVGFQKFKVYARKETTDPEFEAAEQGIIDKLKLTQDEDYEPTDEEIAEAYLEIKYYFIQLNTSENNAAYTEIIKLVEDAVIEINDPFILAHQALNGDKLQPPAQWGLGELEDIAKNSEYGEGYEFSLIADKLAVGKPGSAVADTDEVDDEIDNDEADSDESGSDDADAPGTPDVSGIPGIGDQPLDYPIYALAIGLLQLSLEKRGENGSVETNYLIAKTYLDWLDDEEQRDAQPLNRTEARESTEANLERAVSRYNYSSTVFAQRGLNLVWLEQIDAAREQLEFAEEYAPKRSGGVWTMIRKAYEIMDDQDAMDSIDERESEWRQAELRQQIERQQAASTQSQQPITFNFDDFADLEAGADDSGETDEGASSDSDDGAISDTEEGTEDTETAE